MPTMPPLVSTSSTRRLRASPKAWPLSHGVSGHGTRSMVVRTALMVMSAVLSVIGSAPRSNVIELEFDAFIIARQVGDECTGMAAVGEPREALLVHRCFARPQPRSLIAAQRAHQDVLRHVRKERRDRAGKLLGRIGVEPGQHLCCGAGHRGELRAVCL